MTDVYRIFGSELSPYSVKVRSYFRFKGIPHEWVVRSTLNQDEYQRHAKLPLVPLVVGPDGTAWQDSTPIIEAFEARFPEPALFPADPCLAFLSALLEEYADEWGNKPMFHYRWTYPADLESGADRIARSMSPGLDEATYAGVREAVKGRMVPRLALVGSCAATAPAIERSYRRQLTILDRHLKTRKFLFGDRPTLADFGLFGQLYECSTDPTPGALVRETAPTVMVWLERMLSPQVEGPFETWAALEPTLLPLLREEVGAVFFPWTVANAAALAAGEKTFTITLDGAPFTQEPQKYHAKSLAVLRARYAAVGERNALDAVLDRAGCLTPLQAR